MRERMLQKSLICIGFKVLLNAFILQRWDKTYAMDKADDAPSRCNYDNCFVGKPGVLNVHLICHSHNDVGWTETPDVIYNEYVQEIYSSVTAALQKSRDRKYVSAETAFFERWWQDQLPPRRNSVRKLVLQGQLEMVGGGWVQNDEATTHYTAIVDQMSLGMRWLNDTFGECGRPRAAWQIDTYGHSRENAALFAQMGFDAVFLGRVHVEDKEYRRRQRSMEFLWNADRNIGAKANLLACILPNVYMPPRGFCFDKYSCTTDSDVLAYNARTKARQFIDIARQYAKHYDTQNVVVTMGGDLAYTKAETWFDNLDRLISAVNREASSTGIRLQVFYSSPHCYLKALKAANRTWPVHTRDFLPYADRPRYFWTGFYASRPSLKRHARHANGFLQACKQMAVIAGLRGSIHRFKKAVATLQHHDAITGTCSEKAAQSYVKLIGESIYQCEKLVSDGLVSLLWRDPDSYEETLQFCHGINETVCYVTENEEEFLVVAYNSLSHKLKHYVRIPVPHEDGYKVETLDHKVLEAQVVSMVNTELDLPVKKHAAMNELVFQAELPPLGAAAYHVSRVPAAPRMVYENYDIFKVELEEYSIENEKYRLVVDVATGLLRELIVLERGETVPLRQSFFCYEAQHGSSRAEGIPSSGAYIFSPADDEPYDLGMHVTYRVVKGSIVHEIQQVFDSWITQVIRLYKGLDLIEFEWMVGPIPVESRRSGVVGREVVSRFTSNIMNDGVFYTDSNGRTTIERRRGPVVRKGEDNWKSTASQYYPAVSWVYIKVHRRLVADDGCGLSEALNDTSVAHGRHWLHLGPVGWTHMRHYALRLVYTPVLAYSRLAAERVDSTLAAGNFTGLSEELPADVHLLTLEALSNTRVLLRLEHLRTDKDTTRPTTVTKGSKDKMDKGISITNLLTDSVLEDVREASLSGDMMVEEMRRFEWRQTQTSYDYPTSSGLPDTVRDQSGYRVRLGNGRIRTFYASLTHNSR
ncbi:lysosomal alpha-mannosidase-like isoform X2 [Haemaphysalis longicornis]